MKLQQKIVTNFDPKNISSICVGTFKTFDFFHLNFVKKFLSGMNLMCERNREVQWRYLAKVSSCNILLKI